MRTQPCDIVTKKRKKKDNSCAQVLVAGCCFPWFMVPVIFNIACIFSVHQF